jgi:hypothetical protein
VLYYDGAELQAESAQGSFMSNLWYFPLLLAVAVTYKFCVNAYYARRTRALRDDYVAYATALARGGGDWEFVHKIPEIKELVKRANAAEPRVTRMEPVGYGHVQQQNISVIDNIPANDREIAQLVVQLLHDTEATFNFRKKQAYSLTYWIEILIYLPSTILQYLGVPASSMISKAANAIAWILGVVGFIIALPDFEHVRDTISRFLARLFK